MFSIPLVVWVLFLYVLLHFAQKRRDEKRRRFKLKRRKMQLSASCRTRVSDITVLSFFVFSRENVRLVVKKKMWDHLVHWGGIKIRLMVIS